MDKIPIDEIEIFRRALSAKDIHNFYLAGSGF
jgi:hypothetical protein